MNTTKKQTTAADAPEAPQGRPDLSHDSDCAYRFGHAAECTCDKDSRSDKTAHTPGPWKVMMKCGHAANATNMKTNAPSCAICAGLTPDADIIETNETRFDLTGRVAVCPYCEIERKSDANLPFFEYGRFGKPAEKDSFYCGCRGWD